jgi:hypothetical protein
MDLSFRESGRYAHGTSPILFADSNQHGPSVLDFAQNCQLSEPSTSHSHEGGNLSRSMLVYCEGMIDAAAGKRREALAIINQLEKQSGPELRYASWIARIAAALNEKDLALSWLERGFDAQAIVVFFRDEPLWDPLRNEPCFTDLVTRMGFQS